MNQVEHKTMYLGTIRELESKLATDDYYSLVRASGLMRQLLADSHCLMDSANEDFGLKLQFEVLAQEPISRPDTFDWISIDPSPVPGTPCTRKVNHEQLLKVQCGSVNGDCFTVLDIIRACAHVKGGVHIGEAKRSQEKLVVELDQVTSIGSRQPSLTSLCGIIRVVLAGLA